MTPEFSDSGVPQTEAQILASYFQDASKRLKQMILKPVGRTQSSREFRQARSALLLTQVDDVLRGLKAKSSGWVGKRVPQAYREGLLRGDQQARDAGVRVPESGVAGSFSVIDQRTAAIFARDTAADLYKAADSMGDRAKSVLRQTGQIGLSEAEINKILAGGVIEGQPVETIRTLRESLRAVHGDKVQIVNRNGTPMEFDVGYYAEMVARTKTREATVTARHERLQQLDLDLVAIVGRISTNFCSAFLGQVFSLSGKSGKYPAYASLPGGGPPFHPNCSKSTRPYVDALATPRQAEEAEILPDAQKLLGMDPAKAQKAFQDLQLHAQVKERYSTVEGKVFGPGRAA